MSKTPLAMFKRRRVAIALAGATMVSAASMQVSAQENTIEEVIVSASRIAARPGYEAPTPTTSLDAAFIEDMTTANVADALNRMPSMGTANSPRTNGNNTSTPTQGANFLNLRGLGTNRTLVLLDRRRVVGAAVTGQVDINLLPTTLLKQTDIVTGGASAAWGSDAVAGVVNLVLDKEYTGFKASIQGGTSSESDADETQMNFAGGFEFADGRGHFIGSLNYASTDGVDRADSRDWFKGTKLVGNPAWEPGNGQPQRLVLDNVGQFIGSDAGHTFLTAGPLGGITFAPDGSTLPFDFGTRFPRGPLSTSMTGDGQLNDFAARTALSVGFEQINTFLRASYDVTDRINVYGEYLYGNTEAETVTVPYYRFAGALTVQRDNPFLPADLAAQMDNFGMTSLPMGRSNIDFGRANPYNDRTVTRFVVGADIDLNDNWSLETYFQTGETDIHAEVRSNADQAKYALAVDAVDDGNGNIVCRSVATNPDCVAADVFGLGAPSQAAIDYVIGTAVQDTTVAQDVFAITATGDVLELPAGPLSAAFGYEYREESFDSVADELSKVNGWWTGNYKDADGAYHVNEFFGEVAIPVFVDSPMGEAFDVSAAVRSTDYSTSGGVTTWKYGFTYNIAAGVSLRATKSRDIRAPNLEEYFSGGITNQVFFDDSVTNEGDDATLVARTIAGNPFLNPEEADTQIFGIVYKPEFVEGLVVSIDFFDIDINEAINSLEDQTILDGCVDGSRPDFCSRITRNNDGSLARVFNGPINFSTEKLSGYDLEVNYGFEMAGGNVDIRSLWTKTDEHYTINGGQVDDLLGEYAGGNGAFAGGPQEWVGLTSIRYENDRFNVSLRNRYIGSGVIDASWTSGVDVDNNKVDSVNYFDFTAATNIAVGDGQAQVFFSVDNIFDKEPPRVGFDGGTALDDLGASNSAHDLIGRYFRAGIRYEF